MAVWQMQAMAQRPHSRNFPKTFSQNLPTSDDLGMPRGFLIRILERFLCVS